MSGSSRSGLLKALGAAVTVIVAFALIGAGVQLARSAEGYKVKTAALGELASAPVTVIDDDAPSAAPSPPVLTPEEADAPPTRGAGRGGRGGGAPPGGGGPGGGGGDDGDGSTPVPVPSELDPIVGLVDDVTGATSGALPDDDENSSDPTAGETVDATVDETTATVDSTVDALPGAGL